MVSQLTAHPESRLAQPPAVGIQPEPTQVSIAKFFWMKMSLLNCLEIKDEINDFVCVKTSLTVLLSLQIPMVSPPETFSTPPPMYQSSHTADPRPQTDSMDPIQASCQTSNRFLSIYFITT